MGKSLPLAVCLGAGVVWAAATTGIAPAQDDPVEENPMLGAWMTVDPATGVHDALTVTSDHFILGEATPPIPYRFEEDGEALSVWLGDGEEPARFRFFDGTNAQLSVPGGPAITLKRQVATATEASENAAAGPAAVQESIIEAAVADLLEAATMAPGRPPQDPSYPTLQGLLADGWQLDQISGSDDGLTLLMSNGGYHALCVLPPRQTSTDTATSDCRHLN